MDEYRGFFGAYRAKRDVIPLMDELTRTRSQVSQYQDQLTNFRAESAQMQDELRTLRAVPAVTPEDWTMKLEKQRAKMEKKQAIMMRQTEEHLFDLEERRVKYQMDAFREGTRIRMSAERKTIKHERMRIDNQFIKSLRHLQIDLVRAGRGLDALKAQYLNDPEMAMRIIEYEYKYIFEQMALESQRMELEMSHREIMGQSNEEARELEAQLRQVQGMIQVREQEMGRIVQQNRQLMAAYQGLRQEQKAEDEGLRQFRRQTSRQGEELRHQMGEAKKTRDMLREQEDDEMRQVQDQAQEHGHPEQVMLGQFQEIQNNYDRMRDGLVDDGDDLFGG